MREASKAEAIQAMEQHVAEIRGGRREALVKQRFADFAVTLFEEKRKAGDFRSSATIERWKDVLIHLVGGTEGKSGLKVSGLGEVYVHMLEEPIRQWRVCMAELVAAGDYAPSTLNSWLSILRVITKGIKYDQRLERDPCERIKKFDESEHVTYSEEQPNALPPERAGEFLAHMFRLFPQHYAMTYLGFVTGLRPSSLRPLRRRGVDADVKWETSRLIVRQSQTIGDRVMKSTKQKKHYAIDLPKDVIDTLRWHVETQLRRPEQHASDLLFPSDVGGFRTRSVLDKPFNTVAKEMGLSFRLTAKGMRRTFQDMARLAKIEGIVTRSISGHATERMQQHYSTVQREEQRDGIAQVIELYGPSAAAR
jgi:integrase